MQLESPLHRENWKKNQKEIILCQGKRREFGNAAKTQTILYAQFVNYLIDNRCIIIYAVKISNFHWKLNASAKSVVYMTWLVQITEIGTSNLQFDRENTGF